MGEDKIDTAARGSTDETIKLAFNARAQKREGPQILHIIQAGVSGGWRGVECRLEDLPKLIDALQRIRAPE